METEAIKALTTTNTDSDASPIKSTQETAELAQSERHTIPELTLSQTSAYASTNSGSLSHSSQDKKADPKKGDPKKVDAATKMAVKAEAKKEAKKANAKAEKKKGSPVGAIVGSILGLMFLGMCIWACVDLEGCMTFLCKNH